MRTVRFVLPVMLILAVAAWDDAVGPRYIEIIEVTVGPTLARYYGAFGQQIRIVVDGKLFYDGVDGVTSESG